MRRSFTPQIEPLEGKKLTSVTETVVGHTLRIVAVQDNTNVGVFWKDSAHQTLIVEIYNPQTREVQDIPFDGSGIKKVSAFIIGNNDAFVADFEDPTGLLPVHVFMAGNNSQFLGMKEKDWVIMIGMNDTAQGGGGKDHITIINV